MRAGRISTVDGAVATANVSLSCPKYFITSKFANLMHDYCFLPFDIRFMLHLCVTRVYFRAQMRK